MNKYFIKDSMRFNLEGMRDHVRIIWFDFFNGKRTKKVVCCDKVLSSAEEAQSLIDEIDSLLWESRRGNKVEGKTYGRIKAISDERNHWRYSVNSEVGMDSSRAIYAVM